MLQRYVTPRNGTRDKRIMLRAAHSAYSAVRQRVPRDSNARRAGTYAASMAQDGSTRNSIRRRCNASTRQPDSASVRKASCRQRYGGKPTVLRGTAHVAARSTRMRCAQRAAACVRVRVRAARAQRMRSVCKDARAMSARAARAFMCVRVRACGTRARASLLHLSFDYHFSLPILLITMPFFISRH